MVLESAKRTRKTTLQFDPRSSVISLSGSMRMNRERLETVSPNSSPSGSRRFTMTVMHAPRGYRINLNHRMEMVKKEIEEIKRSLKEMDLTCIRKRANLTARLEEAEIRILETAEIKKEFQEKFVKSATNNLTEKISADKFIRYIEGRLKVSDNMIHKLRLKTSELKTQIKKKKEQLDARREISEALRPIEFEQLAIENEIYERQIQERTKHFLEMKKEFGRFNVMVTNNKQNLSEKQAILQNIKRDIESKNSNIEKLKEEKKIREAWIAKAEQENKKCSKLNREYMIPDFSLNL
ncbi:coiled-coil domain-containing protein 113-like isoform X2 [Belonocnema kinseyi]|uniref:coiled-coil domain-containing protein 113-like isoform X2 n=1 Tax=Belonocnema kinseyi TaxID=2817044 RepID=UPI00143DDA51|nr:coiled-coil domain-containing protein 113-like isoform X2 [Belonocnema kinseyi]